jgi:deazaflavin-dependent oxidoreductase (nitroreductase family)
LPSAGVDAGMPEMNDFNQQMIQQFRENHGKLGGPFEGATMLLLHHTGAKSGKERVNPLAYQPLGANFAIFASKGGAPTNPDWYHNLLAHPDTTVEVGSETIPVRARVVASDERQLIWEKQKQLMPGFAEYEAKTDRQIPVIVLERS